MYLFFAGIAFFFNYRIHTFYEHNRGSDEGLLSVQRQAWRKQTKNTPGLWDVWAGTARSMPQTTPVCGGVAGGSCHDHVYII